MVAGTAAILPTVLQTYPLTEIQLTEVSSGNKFKKDAVIINVKECFGTVIAVGLNNNLGYIFGYAPVISNGKFTDHGELYIYKRENGISTEMKHIIRTLGTEVENNEIIEFIREGALSVSIESKTKFAFIIWDGYGYLIH